MSYLKGLARVHVVKNWPINAVFTHELSNHKCPFNESWLRRRRNPLLQNRQQNILQRNFRKRQYLDSLIHNNPCTGHRKASFKFPWSILNSYRDSYLENRVSFGALLNSWQTLIYTIRLAKFYFLRYQNFTDARVFLRQRKVQIQVEVCLERTFIQHSGGNMWCNWTVVSVGTVWVGVVWRPFYWPTPKWSYIPQTVHLASKCQQ